MNTHTPRCLSSHPLTAPMIRRDKAMTGRRASNLQWHGMGQIREGRGAVEAWEVIDDPNK